MILLWLRLVFILQVMIEWAFAFAFALPRTRIQLKKTQQEKQRNKTRKGTTKQERGKQTRSKNKKKEVWESKWAILISLEVKITHVNQHVRSSWDSRTEVSFEGPVRIW